MRANENEYECCGMQQMNLFLLLVNSLALEPDKEPFSSQQVRDRWTNSTSLILYFLENLQTTILLNEEITC